jgi:hypothetical protein
VRALDILGAEILLPEYEACLHLKLKRTFYSEYDLRKNYGHRLPVCVFDRLKLFQNSANTTIIDKIGSQRLISYFLRYHKNCRRDHVFINLFLFEHFTIAQRLYSLGGINIHVQNDYAFHIACQKAIICRLYNLDACKSGHFEVIFFFRWKI